MDVEFWQYLDKKANKGDFTRKQYDESQVDMYTAYGILIDFLQEDRNAVAEMVQQHIYAWHRSRRMSKQWQYEERMRK